MSKSYPLYLAVRMLRYGSLIKINPSDLNLTNFKWDSCLLFWNLWYEKHKNCNLALLAEWFYYLTFVRENKKKIELCFSKTCGIAITSHFSNLEKQNNRKQCSLLAWLWDWPSGSLMTPVLFYINFKMILSCYHTKWQRLAIKISLTIHNFHQHCRNWKKN